MHISQQFLIAWQGQFSLIAFVTTLRMREEQRNNLPANTTTSNLMTAQCSIYHKS